MEERSFGFWLRRYRKALDLTQDDLAGLVGCSKESIRKIEANRQRPSRQIAERLAQHLGVPPDERATFINCARAERAYTSPGASSPPPASAPWQTPSYQPRSNLPIPSTPLIGRDRTIAALRDRLLREDVRLLTLSGAPGIGKTRLGMQVATELVPTFDDGVYFVDLAPVRDPNMVAAAIAQTLGLSETGSQVLWGSLQQHLQDKHTLLLLDNFEHMLPAAPLLATLLATCSWLKLLVTSRALLRLSAEHEFVVPPLALPDLQALPPVGNLAHYAAIDLFVRRTQAHKPDFALSEANAAAVAEICVRLDGLPLAIELAAARGKLFAPQALLARLASRMGLLTGGAHDLPARQQTLRSTIDWSYELLDASEQALFRRLGVFVGGCTLEAAEAICAGPGLEIEYGGRQAAAGFSVLDGLTALVDRSLLRQVEATDGEPRFMMLETIREYALEQLEASGEAEAVRRQHAAYYLALAEAAEPKLTRSAEQELWFDRLEREHPNLRSALALYQAEEDGTEKSLRLAGALGIFWSIHGYFSEGRGWLAHSLTQSGVIESTPARAKALRWSGLLAYAQGNLVEARAFVEESLEISRVIVDQCGIAESIACLGTIALSQGDYEQATALLNESQGLYSELGDNVGVGSVLHSLGIVAQVRGDYERARTIFEQRLAEHRQLGNKLGIASVLTCLGELARLEGDYECAVMFNEESLDLYRQLGDQDGIALSFSNLGYIVLHQGDYERAATLHKEGLYLYRKLENQGGVASCLAGLAGVVRGQGQVEQAARLLGAAEALRDTVDVPLAPADRSDHDRIVAAVRSQLPEATFAALWAEGRALPLEQVIAEALGAEA